MRQAGCLLWPGQFWDTRSKISAVLHNVTAIDSAEVVELVLVDVCWLL